MRRLRWLALSIVLPACASSNPHVLQQAAIGTAFAVAAAAANRAATGECWGSCQPGTRCDHASGTCVPIPNEPSNVGSPRPREPEPAASASIPSPEETPNCRGLCLSGERCVLQNGVSDCVAIGDAGNDASP